MVREPIHVQYILVEKIYTSLVDDLLCIVHLICVVFFKKIQVSNKKISIPHKKEKDNLFVLLKQRKGQWRHTIGSTDEVE